MQDLPNGGGAPIQSLAPGRWRPSLRHWVPLLVHGHWDLGDSGTSRDYDAIARSLGWLCECPAHTLPGAGWQCECTAHTLPGALPVAR